MKKHPGKALANMVLSCVLCSIAVNWVALPNGFVVTGITGLSMDRPPNSPASLRC